MFYCLLNIKWPFQYQCISCSCFIIRNQTERFSSVSVPYVNADINVYYMSGEMKKMSYSLHNIYKFEVIQICLHYDVTNNHT